MNRTYMLSVVSPLAESDPNRRRPHQVAVFLGDLDADSGVGVLVGGLDYQIMAAVGGTAKEYSFQKL